MRTIRSTTWKFTSTFLLLAAMTAPAFGQAKEPAPDAPLVKKANARLGVLFSPSREKSRAMRHAVELVQQGKFLDALRILQKMIDADNDAFFADSAGQGNTYVSLKAESMRLIETLPPKGREIYELKYGAKARIKLNDALRDGDFAEIESIARRFFHTAAGYRATYVLAIHQRDRGLPLSAALQFERLRKLKNKDDRNQFEPMLSLQAAVCWGLAGLPKNAASTLVELKAFLGGRPVNIGGRNVAMFNKPDEALPWLAGIMGEKHDLGGAGAKQWVMFRGNAERTAYSSPASPAWDANWTIDTVRDPDTERNAVVRVAQEIESYSETRRKNGLLMQPAYHPLLIGDIAVFKTLQNVWAVNIRTGAILWKADVKDITYRQVNGLAAAPNVRRSSSRIKGTPLQLLLDQRLWRDMTAGTMSSDGELVFSINHLGYYDSSIRYSGTRSATGNYTPGFNTLSAFNVRTGEKVFQLGGAESKKLLLADHFFLGPPLPVGNQLFVLADYRGEIRLISLGMKKVRYRDGTIIANPRVVWSQSLVTPEDGVERFPLRRMAGLSPSFAGGILVCPTTAGAIVAVDPTRRQLLWGYRYPTNMDGQSRSRSRYSYGLPMNPYDAESRWLDAGITVAEGRLILTPRDSNELHCIDMDGNVVWKQPRGPRLYVAGVHNERLMLVGKTQFEAIRVADGTAAWSEPMPIPTPAGRGFRTGDVYHLPLEPNEIASIDLKSGRVITRAKLRSELRPGNLVAANGIVVSQTVDGLIGFRTLDALQTEIAARLNANARDARALATRGELRLRSGDEAGGLADLRAAIAANGDSAKSLIASHLLEKMRLDFQSFRNHRAELERYMAEDDRGRYHRLLADGLYRAGEFREAMRQYLKLAGPFAGPWKQERAGDVSVRGDRWLRARMAAIFRKADDADRKQLTAEIDEQLKEAIRYGDPKGLRRYLHAFGELPGTEAARLKLVEQLNPVDNALEMELVLLRLRESDDPKTAGFATARLTDLLLQHKHLSTASEFVADLATRFKTVKCLSGKTGLELAKHFLGIWPQLAPKPAWPAKRIVTRTTRSPSRRSYGYHYHATFVGDPGFFKNWSFSFTSNSRVLNARDGNGKVRWSLPFTYSSSYHYYTTKVRAFGHMLVIQMADNMMVVDAMKEQPNVIWQRNLFSSSNSRVRRSYSLNQKKINGRTVWEITDRSGMPLGDVGYVSDRAIVYQAGRTVIAADPLTGDVLWQRDAIERGSLVFGGEQNLFIVQPDTTTTLVLRTTDGAQIATRRVAAKSDRQLVKDRFELTWRMNGDKRQLAWVDILAKKVVWKKQFSGKARLDLIEGEEVAVMEPSKGRFHVLSLADGKSRIDAPIEPDPDIEYCLVRRSRNRYVVMTYSAVNRDDKVASVTALNSYDPVVNGFVYGFDRSTGEKIWTTYVGNQTIELTQPGSLPVIAFSGRRYMTTINGGATRRVYTLAMTILDIRNGRIVLDFARPESTAPYHLVVDPETKRIEYKFYYTNVTLSLSKKPLGKPSNRVVLPNP